jgi:hypothetical protein
MSGSGAADGATGRELLERRAEARRRADLVSGLRRLSRGGPADGAATPPAAERCDLCGNEIPSEHRHLLHLVERRILCACESCVAMRSGDPELRPTGTRTEVLDDFELSDELWASFGIPIGLAFFMESSTAGGVIAFYPSPAGSTESELDLDAWEELRSANPALAGLEADAEALVVDRISQPPQHAIAPIDQCYRLVGMIRASWEGISGGTGPERAIQSFFGELRAGAGAT